MIAGMNHTPKSPVSKDHQVFAALVVAGCRTSRAACALRITALPDVFQPVQVKRHVGVPPFFNTTPLNPR